MPTSSSRTLPTLAPLLRVSADGLICSTPFHPGYATREVIEKAKNLKVCITAGVGSDHVDLDAANEKKLLVAEVSGYVPSLRPRRSREAEREAILRKNAQLGAPASFRPLSLPSCLLTGVSIDQI